MNVIYILYRLQWESDELEWLPEGFVYDLKLAEIWEGQDSKNRRVKRLDSLTDIILDNLTQNSNS